MVYKYRSLKSRNASIVRLRKSIAARRIQRAVKRRQSAKRSMLTAMIRKQVSRIAEKKIAVSRVDDNQLSYTYGANLDFQIFQMSPGGVIGFNIPQGTGQHQRVGNAIKIHKAVSKLVFNAQPWIAGVNDNPNPFYLRMFLLYNKQDSHNEPALGTSQDFFQSGASTYAFSGSTKDWTFSINKDKYRVLWQKTLKMGFSTTYVNQTQLLGPQQDSFGAPNPDFKPFQRVYINYTKMLHKNVKYNDSNSIDPSTRGLYLFMYCIRADGDQGPPTGGPGTQFPVRWSMCNTLEFTDV